MPEFTLYARIMRRSLWTVAVAVLAFGGLGMVGGTAIGGSLGPLTAAYGAILTLAALYVIAVLAIRERTWRRPHDPTPPGDLADRRLGRRIF